MIKVKKRKFLLLPGDGIGPEVIAEVKKIINWFNTNKSLDFKTDEDLVGGTAYDKHGTPITSGPMPSPGSNKNFLFLTLIIKNPWFGRLHFFFK